jgi:hypothetical protein
LDFTAQFADFFGYAGRSFNPYDSLPYIGNQPKLFFRFFLNETLGFAYAPQNFSVGPYSLYEELHCSFRYWYALTGHNEFSGFTIRRERVLFHGRQRCAAGGQTRV